MLGLVVGGERRGVAALRFEQRTIQCVDRAQALQLCRVLAEQVLFAFLIIELLQHKAAVRVDSFVIVGHKVLSQKVRSARHATVVKVSMLTTICCRTGGSPAEVSSTYGSIFCRESRYLTGWSFLFGTCTEPYEEVGCGSK